MQLIDTHCHLDLPVFAADHQQVVERSRQHGVTAFVLPGVIRRGWPRLLELCAQSPDHYPAIGLHPMYMKWHSIQADLEELERRARSGLLVGLGEIGLDYHIADPRREQQQNLFEAQLVIAANHGLPLLLHVRKAHDQVQATLRRHQFRHGGIVHAYSGSLQQAEHYIKLGFKIAFGGTITYDRATKVRSVAASLPQKSLVLETDAPDIPPSGHNGERNSPEHLPLILEALARIRQESPASLAQRTTKNALSVLKLDHS